MEQEQEQWTAEEKAEHVAAWERGLLAVDPRELTGWPVDDLPRWHYQTEGQRTDTLRAARLAAQNTGMPQSVQVPSGGVEVYDVDYRVRAALLGVTR